MSKRAPLSWLRSFEASARHSSFTRAADELNITQAAVSKQIKALEAQLRCQLFKRQAHGLELTEQGRRYWLDTCDLIQQLDKVTSQFVARQQTNKIHIRANISYSALVLSHQLAFFRNKNPDISIEITHDIWEPGQSSNNAHLEIGYGIIDHKSSGAEAHLISQDKLFPVVADHVTEEKASTLPLIRVTGYYREWRWWLEQVDGMDLSDAVKTVFGRHRLEDGRNDWYVDNSMIAYQLAAEGLGIALGRSSLVNGLLKNNSLKRIETFGELSAEEGFFIRKTDLGAVHEPTQRLHDFLVQVRSA